MAKIQNPVIGRSKGSAGGMTFTKSYANNVMRAKAFEVANPKTAAQTTQRDFFREAQGIAQSLSSDQLRSLFGSMPKGMSRRNALTRQIAAAYTINDGVKSVDFSQLEAIGNGAKVTTPYVEFSNGETDDDTEITAAMLGVSATQNPNLILVAFDSIANRIILINTSLPLDGNYATANIINMELPTLTGFAYITCDTNGNDVSGMDFGSFIIKTRAEKKGSSTQKDTPLPGNCVEITGHTTNSEVILNFSNYNFNNLSPGDLYIREGIEEIALVKAGDWVLQDVTAYRAELSTNIDEPSTCMLNIMQKSNLIDSVIYAIFFNEE